MSLFHIFTDSDQIIQTWDDYCEMCDGIEACQIGLECPDESSHPFRHGYGQEYARLEAQTA